MKQTRIYELYQRAEGLTTYLQKCKGPYAVLHVAAKNIRHAYYVAGNQFWYAADKPNSGGIVEYWPHRGTHWNRYDGTKQLSNTWDHYRVFKPLPEPYRFDPLADFGYPVCDNCGEFAAIIAAVDHEGCDGTVCTYCAKEPPSRRNYI